MVVQMHADVTEARERLAEFSQRMIQ
jgi:hypothetical protein